MPRRTARAETTEEPDALRDDAIDGMVAAADETGDASPAPQPWRPLARLLLARIAEQRRLEEQLDKMTAQRRDTQRAIQQLTEKLEALKAIERSMTAHPAPPPALPGSAAGAESAPPPAPKP